MTNGLPPGRLPPLLEGWTWSKSALDQVQPSPDQVQPSHSTSIFGHFCWTAGSPMPLDKHFRPFLLVVWLAHATRQAFSAIFAHRLARPCHTTSIFGHFCSSSGFGPVMPGTDRASPVILSASCHAERSEESILRGRGYSVGQRPKRGPPSRLTANASLLAPPSACLTVVERTPSCCFAAPLPAQAPAPSRFGLFPPEHPLPA